MNEHPVPPLLETLLERIDDRLIGREALELEFKKASGNVPKSMWETVSAFANTSGGWIVLGVNDEVKPPAIEGVANAHNLLQTFFNLMRNEQKISAEVCGATDAAIEELGGKEVIVIHIPAAPRKQRPVYIDGNPYRGTFVRRHSGDYRCNKAEVDRMMRDASEASADATILQGFGWDDLDRDTFARYRRRFQTAKPDHPWLGFSDEAFLQALNGYRRDRNRAVEGLTVAGLLMFGRPESIREWRTRHLFDFRVLVGDLRSAAEWDDRFIWEGNLLGAFETISPRLTAGLPTPFRLVDGVRVEDTPVHRALREALVNLLIHADYAETDSSLILRSPEGFLFRNPGNSRVPIGELTLGRHSDPRNPELVFMFRQINLAEEAGSGIQRIFSTWRALGFTLPSIDVGTDRYEFTLQLRHVHLFTDEDRVWLRSLAEQWDEPEQLALLSARHDGDVDNARLRSLTGQHPADATKVLRSLRERGFLEMTGWGRGASYQLGARASAGLSQLLIPGLENQARIAGQDAASSFVDSGASLVGTGVDLVDSGGSLVDGRPSIGDNQASLGGEAASPDNQETLLRIARPIRMFLRVPARELNAAIVQICSVEPLSVRQIADLLDRSDYHIRMTIRELVAQGAIAPLYPQRRHPDQRYTIRHDDTVGT